MINIFYIHYINSLLLFLNSPRMLAQCSISFDVIITDYPFKNVYIGPQKLQKKYQNVTEHLNTKKFTGVEPNQKTKKKCDLLSEFFDP